MPEKDETTSDAENQVRTAPQLSPKLRKQIGVAADDSGSASNPDTSKKKKGSAAAKEASKPEETAKSDAADDSMKRSVDLDDERTDEAVKDIVSYEGDVMLAVSDATAEERTREAEASTGDQKEGGGWLSALAWTLVIFVAIVAVALLVVLATGGNVTGLKT